MMEPAVIAGDAKQKPGVPFRMIRGSIQTGDLILFKGGELVSAVIAEIEEHYNGVDSFSHAGMAILAKDLPADSILRRPDDNDKLYIIESTGSGRWIDGVPAVTDNKGHLGVQLRDLDLVVESYDTNPKTRMAWLPLQKPAMDTVSSQKLDATVIKYIGQVYDCDCVSLFAAAIPCMRCVRDSWTFRHLRGAFCCLCCCGSKPSSWLFCSELVSQIYIDWGIFPDTVAPEDVLPTDFLPKGFETPGATETSTLVTADADKQVPWVFKGVHRYHK